MWICCLRPEHSCEAENFKNIELILLVEEIPWTHSVRLQPGCFLLPLASFTEKAARNEKQRGFGE